MARQRPKNGSPRIPPWREFEQLVSRIEQCLAPEGAIVTSPDHLPSNVIGRNGKTSTREVDASIRLHVGSAPVLITIETRKRRPIQDVTWIEQLGSKKLSLGAATTIAVSATGFSDHARDTAERYGILLRTLNEITPDDIRGWMAPQVLVHFYRHSGPGDISLIPYDEPGDTPAIALAEEVVAALAERQGIAPVLIDANGRALSINDVWLKVQEAQDFFQGLIPGGPAERRNIQLRLKKGDVSILTTSGLRSLKEIVLSFDLSIKREDVPLSAAKIIEYASLDQPEDTHQRIEFTTTAASLTNVRVGVQGKPGTTQVRFSVEPLPKSPDSPATQPPATTPPA